MSDVATPALVIEHLTTELRSGGEIVTAVNDVSLTLRRGETYCLVGESGSGKSVTALSLLQLLPKRITRHPSGVAYLSGEQDAQSLLTLPDAAMNRVRGSRIAMIFQEPMTSLNPVFTVGEQIAEAILLHNPGITYAQSRQRALEALQQVRLKQAEQRLDDYPHQLSGGQRQRVMIAIAMACEPDILIADEPTTALDVTVQAEILALMKRLQQETGMAILFITHDFGVVAKMADRVGVMRYGKLVEENTLDNILQRPEHDYTRGLLRALPENLPRPPSRAAESALPAEPLIRVEDLKVWFPVRKGVLRRHVSDIKAVDGVSLTIHRGEVVALVGESGCGKSTLGRAVIQLIRPTAGRVWFKDDDITGLSHRELQRYRQEMQIIFQDPLSSLNPRLRIVTTLTEPMQVHGIGRSREERIELAAQVLEDVQLKREHLWRYPHEFSGGQRQRIGIARALVLNPGFIVCDEVTSALDVSVQAEILNMLLELRQQRSLALLFITHDIGVVEYISDRTVVMQQGRVVEQGATARVCKQPSEVYTQQLLAAVPRLPSSVFR